MILSVVFILGCQPAAAPAQPPAQPAAPAASPTPVPEPSVTITPSETVEKMPAKEIPPAPLENIPTPPETGVDIEKVCYGLLASEDFTSLCGHAGKVVLTPKISEGGCWVNIADHQNNKLTAGFTTVDWKKPVEANEEFDRGVRMRRTQGASESKTVGERSYEYKELERHNVVWIRGAFLTRIGAMTALCPASKLVDVAKKIDAGLR